MMTKADIIKISDEDVLWMTKGKNFAKFAKTWLKRGAKIVAITKGGEGSEIYTKDFSFKMNVPPVKVVDTVGAGDTFTAGLLAYLSKQKLLTKQKLAGIDEASLSAAVAFAMRAAAVTVSRAGADPPWSKEMK